MRKLLLMMAAGVMTATAAQADVQMLLDNTVLEPGSTTAWNKIVSDGGVYMIKPPLYLLSDKATTVGVEAVCTSGQTVMLCCGGACVAGENVKKDAIALQAGTKLDMEFHYESFMAETPEELDKNIVTEFTVTEQGGATNVYTIVMNDPTGEVKVLGTDCGVYADGNGIVYNVSGRTAVSVYDTNGRLVLDTAVEGTGTVDLSSLGKGVYLYRLNGAANVSGKLMK